MKQFFKYAAGLLVIMIVSTSCQDVVTVDLKEGEILLVVDAWVNNEPGTQNVKLTTTSPYFSNTNVPPVSGASVVLNDITNNKNYVFADAGYGNYSYTPAVTDTMCVVGHQYRLDVTYQGNSYNSFSTLHRTTTVDTIMWRSFEGQAGFKDGLYPYIVAQDVAGAKDYYWIKAYHNGTYISNPDNINLCEDAGGGDGTDGLFFIPPNAFYAVTDKPFAENDICTIEILSINKNSFDFLTQAYIQMINSGLFANTPENVRTNINPVTSGAPKALGWFNMGAGSVKVSVAKKP